jgi:dihydroorotate dehydrogenase
MDIYKFIKPAIFSTDPEKAHSLAISGIKLGLHPIDTEKSSNILSQNILNLSFDNPIGMAAGFDKNGEVPNELLKMGFGFVEVGTVTPRPQEGNPKPRIFRLEEAEGMINRLGFNSKGAEKVKLKLKNRQKIGVLGVNIGANKDSDNMMDDYIYGLKTFYKIADYITINISSPNTPNLRKLQQKQNIRELLNLISAEKPINCNLPILLKISPDINQTELSDIIEAAIDSKIDGLIISNTTIDKSMVGKIKNSHQDGGLSGKPLFNLSTRLLAKAYTISEGKIPLIGVGGISNGYDAFLKIKAGASLIQLYTGLVFQGPHVAINIKKELSTLLKEQGFNSIKEIVGIESKNYK